MILLELSFHWVLYEVMIYIKQYFKTVSKEPLNAFSYCTESEELHSPKKAILSPEFTEVVSKKPIFRLAQLVRVKNII